MARSYVAASSNRDIWTGSWASLSRPVSMAAWFNRQDNPMSGNMDVCSFGNSGGSSAWRLVTTAAGNILARSTNTAGTNADATTSGSTFNRDEWHHACAVHAASTSRAAYLDGGNKGTNSGTNTTSGINRFAIAFTCNSTIANHFTGYIAEQGAWNLELLDEDVATLALGVCPLLVRPEGLLLYAPMVGDGAKAVCWIQGPANTTNGTPGIADHPPQPIYPGGKQFYSTWTPTSVVSFTATNPSTVGMAMSGDLTGAGDIDHCEIDWGDSTTSTVTSGVTANHTYAAAATRTLVASVVGLDGTTATSNATITVAAASSLTIDDFSALPLAIGVDDTVATNYSFTGTPTLALLDYGDGTTNTVTGTTTDEHPYTAEGTYTLTLSISDASESDTATAGPVVVTADTPVEPPNFPPSVFPGNNDIEPDVFPEIG